MPPVSYQKAPVARPVLRRQWFPAATILTRRPLSVFDWLGEQGSLTARLVSFSEGQFKVKILSQHWGVAALSERRTLGLKPRARVLIREVILLGRGQPWVYARSILPYSSLTGPLRALAKLDNRPLGGWLFKQPSLRRGPLQISRYLPGDQRLLVLRDSIDLLPARPLLGRRSVFYVADKPLLVGELFLPDFLLALQAAESYPTQCVPGECGPTLPQLTAVGEKHGAKCYLDDVTC